jgi:hypothetical protein
MKLDVKAFGLTVGLLWGLGLFLGTWWMMYIGKATGSPTLLSNIYIGYSITPMGSLVGLVWAFFDGLGGGVIFAWLYNQLCSHGNKE